MNPRRMFLLLLACVATAALQAKEWDEDVYRRYSEWMTRSEMRRTPQACLLDFSSRPQWSYVMGIELEAMLDT